MVNCVSDATGWKNKMEERVQGQVRNTCPERGWRSTGHYTWKMFCVDLLSIVSRTYGLLRPYVRDMFAYHIDLLSIVSHTLCLGNSAVLGKQQLKSKAHGAIQQVFEPGGHLQVRIAMANGVLPRSDLQRSQKVSSSDYLAALSNTQRNATH